MLAYGTGNFLFMTTYRAPTCAAVTALILGLSASPSAIAQASPISADLVTERDIVSTSGDMRENVRSFLASNGATPAAIDSLTVVRDVPGRNGRRHMTYEQRVDGKRVFGSIVKASSEADGSLITVSRRIAEPTLAFGGANMDAAEAVRLAITTNHGAEAPVPGVSGRDGNIVSFQGDSYFWEAPQAEEVYIPGDDGTLELGWTVLTWSNKDNQLFETTINARGEIVDVQNRTASDDRYRIFPDHPGVTPQVLELGPDQGNSQSPVGWIWDGGQNEPGWTQYRRRIRGNNVYAYVDRFNDSIPDNFNTIQSDGEFVSIWDGSQQPTQQTNQNVAVQNLFYHNNLIHDILYDAGFTELTGNFQEDNFGRGGAQSDSVNSEVQDGGGTNNANMATPPDGFNPRMQMYLTSSVGGVQRDTDYDSDVIIHEYGHGLTWRMIGNMSGSVSGAIGEGASDVLAIIINDQDTVGEWSFAAFGPGGIRSQPYGSYTRNMSNFTGTSVHFNGEIYAAAMWGVWERYKANGLTRDEMLADWVDAMNFIAPGPDYLDMRDGLLDAVPSDRDCLVWEAFAERGMGEGAVFNWPSSIQDSFDVPSSCLEGGGDVLVTDFFGVSEDRNNGSRWRAFATIQLDTPNTDVVVDWSVGGADQCTIDSSGVCTVRSNALLYNEPDVTATVIEVGGATPVADQGIDLSIIIGAPGSDPDPDPDPDPNAPLVTDFFGFSEDRNNGARWRAFATVQVDSANADVLVDWSVGGTDLCTTDSSGVCTVRSNALLYSEPDVTATVVEVDGAAPAADQGVDLSIVIGAPGTDPDPDPDPDPEGPVVTDIDTYSEDRNNGSRWRAFITVTVGTPNTLVEVEFSSGGSATCTTDGSGSCTAKSNALEYTNDLSVDVTVTAVDGQAPVAGDNVELTNTILAPGNG